MTAFNINYTPVVLVGLYLIILAMWFKAGAKFRGPKIDDGVAIP